MQSSNDPKNSLYTLVAGAAKGEIDVRSFCSQYETIFNLQLNKASLSPIELTAFQELFDKVVWFSPFPEDLAKVPNYLSESQIQDAVRVAIRNLNKIG